MIKLILIIAGVAIIGSILLVIAMLIIATWADKRMLKKLRDEGFYD